MAVLNIIFPDALAPVLTRVLIEHGASAATDTLVNWLNDMARRQQDADAALIYSKLTLTERDQFKARLELK